MHHRFTSQKGVELIKHFEGFRQTPYVCAGGYLTIGFGHKLLPSDRFNSVSLEKAEQLLRKDLARIERSVIKYIHQELNDNQFAALVSFTFNLGPAALQRSGLRAKVNYGEFKEAAKEFKKWIYAGGRKMPGLRRRRNLEAKLFLYGHKDDFGGGFENNF